MRRMIVFAYSGLVFLSLSPLHAQTAPAAGTSVSVKILDTIDSSNDPAGKQYRASLAKPITATNGVAIAQGSAATVTLTSSASGHTAQLSSITTNGQAVAVTSDSVTISAVAQTVQSRATSAMNSVLGGFGHHVNAPAAVAAVATGQHVSLPAGTTLTFVLGASPVAHTAQPIATSAAPGPTPSSAPASSSAAAPLSANAYYTLCRYQGQQSGHSIVYVTPIIHTDLAASDISTAFNRYMSANYEIISLGGNGYCRTVSNSPGQQAYTMSQLEKQWAASKAEVTHLEWTGTPAEIEATNAKLTARTSAQSAASAGGLFVFCATSGAAGIDIYYTAVFQTPHIRASRPIGTYIVDESIPNDFYAYLTQKGYKFVKPGSFRCVVKQTEAAANAAQHLWAYGGQGGLGDSCCGYGKIVETGWKE